MAPSGPGLTKIGDFCARTDTIRLQDGTKLAFWTWPDSFAREFQIPRDFKFQLCLWHAIRECTLSSGITLFQQLSFEATTGDCIIYPEFAGTPHNCAFGDRSGMEAETHAKLQIPCLRLTLPLQRWTDLIRRGWVDLDQICARLVAFQQHSVEERGSTPYRFRSLTIVLRRGEAGKGVSKHLRRLGCSRLSVNTAV
ncbi:hypothetical protein ASPSYDRAFT_1000256 [Aspergillus sydowii CBS 593.65]|uniref:Uncharacterized protein n=1 Tax=Aspergillus sydowii CBS 593.65 TaxID=1036612 RepID=A0A1L9TI62_9EURO|nr:uncharacterized protein ASPSYDRAFT_1000256 [Aspergillus sydowii CBS 593.65]OJJ59118.1 hypothetical protein ASPSYDRAFT_1000256 [Aspergillus sydowii CBS 593.65]